jgi:hypothetical protein
VLNAALENLDAEVDINRALKSITENIKISTKKSLDCYELKRISHCLTKDVQNY